MKREKRSPAAVIVKLLNAALTLIFPLAMVCTAGAGLIYNGDSYGRELVNLGIALIVSGILMAAGTALCIPDRRAVNIASVICALSGILLCLVMVYRLCRHADAAGWADNYTMEPVSRMYAKRLLPSIAPALLTTVVSVVQIKKKK